MAEIDETKQFESIKDALSIFEQINDVQKDCSTSGGKRDNNFDLVMKNLATCKLQLDIKESAYIQAVAKLEVYHKTLTKLSSQMKLAEADRDKYMKEFKKSQLFIHMLESEYEEVADQLLDSVENNKELIETLDELKLRNEELLKSKAELTAAEESKVAALAKAEMAEKAVLAAKEENNGLLVQVSELQEEIFSSNLAMMEDLEDGILEKTILSDYYQLELMQAKESLVRKDLEREIEKVTDRTCQVDKLTDEIQYMKDELAKSNERELELQVEIATLKSEIHRNKSRAAAAEADEARAMSAQSGLHLAMRQLAMEAETAKEEAERLKLEMVSGITISVEEYENLMEKAKMIDDSPVRGESLTLESGNRSEIEILKEELNAAKAEISDLKFNLGETARKAEMADNAKTAVEDQLRKWREKQKQRRTASEIGHEQTGRRSVAHDKTSASAYKYRTASLQDDKVYSFVPLSKFLNMKI